MSGHSHWKTIHREKSKNDAARGVLFTKAAQQIIFAARAGGGDPKNNLSLRIAIDYAKSVNMPKDNIDRAIKKGTGEDSDIVIERIMYEGLGPGAIGVVVSALTDNKNRTVSELRQIFRNAGGELGGAGSSLWQFNEFGGVLIKLAKTIKATKFGEEDKEQPISYDDAFNELITIEGVEDIENLEDGEVRVFTKMTNLASVTKEIKDKDYIVLESKQCFLPKEKKPLESKLQEKYDILFSALEENPDVEDYWYAREY